MLHIRSGIVASVALVAFAATPVLAEKAVKLSDINGALGRDAEPALQGRGFTHVSTHKNDRGYVYSYWWDQADDDCVQVEVYDGRVQTIQDATDQDCGHHQGKGAEVAGAVVGAALLGALLTHKKHHHGGDDHAQDSAGEVQFERGYSDGLHNAPYHNYDRADSYSKGYSAGVSEREGNLAYHQRRGGYTPTVNVSDLKGAKAAGGMEELDRRGFTQVDNFTSGNDRISIQWRSSSNQCVQVIISDGRFYDLRDIGQHPKCR